MSYEEVVKGLSTRLPNVSGLNAGNLFAYEPQTLQDLPSCYFVLDRSEGSIAGQVRIEHYRVRITVCIRWQDNEAAEVELANFVDKIMGGLLPSPFFSATLFVNAQRGWERDAYYITIAGAKYRALDTYVWVTERVAYP